VDKCIAYSKLMEKKLVPPLYVCYECKEVGKHLARFCPVKRPDLADMERQLLCARCPNPGHFSADCPEPAWDQPDPVKLQELDDKFNSTTNQPQTDVRINAYTGDYEACEESEEVNDDDDGTDAGLVNLAHYRDDGEENDDDTDPGN
jgi:hypothetical protein